MSGLFKLKDHFKENKLYLNRIITATVMVVALFGLLICRLIYLQIYQHELYVTLARNNQIKIVPIQPTRGLIYDRNGVLLAENMPIFSLEIIPYHVKNIPKLLARLAQIITLSETDLKIFKKQLKAKNVHDSVPIKIKLTAEEVAKFSLEKPNYPEVEVVGRLSRNYPYPHTFAHVLGYIGPISENDLANIDINEYRGMYQIGKAGIEKSYEDILRGKVGYNQVETDVRGRIVRTLDTTKPLPGDNIYLNIDSRLQNFAHSLLEGKKGAVVILDVKTGGVLALASNPGYNPNSFAQGIDVEEYQKLQADPEQPLFNRAIRGQYPPGSTVKPIVAIQALEHGIINKDERFFDPGYYRIRNEGRMFRDWTWRKHGHGYVNIETALAESSSTFFYYLSDKLGIDRVYDIFHKFGLGEVLDLDIQGEASGIAPSAAWKRANKNTAWYQGETLITGIGQGYTLVTPLQVAHMAATIANHGQRLQPVILQAIEKANGHKEFISPKYREKVKLNNNNNWNIVISGMEAVIKNPKGTAHSIYKEHRRVAGKTGTAQVFGLKQNEVYVAEKLEEHLRDHGWFMAFTPIDQPQIALAAIIEHSKGSPTVVSKLIDLYNENNLPKLSKNN